MNNIQHKNAGHKNDAYLELTHNQLPESEISTLVMEGNIDEVQLVEEALEYDTGISVTDGGRHDNTLETFSKNEQIALSDHTTTFISPLSRLKRSFPSSVTNNSLIDGPNNTCLLRVCFRLADIVFALKRQQSNTELILEIYCRAGLKHGNKRLFMPTVIGERRLQKIEMIIKDLYYPESGPCFEGYIFADMERHVHLSRLVADPTAINKTRDIVRIIAVPHSRPGLKDPYASTLLEIRKINSTTLKDVKWTQGIVVRAD